MRTWDAVPLTLGVADSQIRGYVSTGEDVSVAGTSGEGSAYEEKDIGNLPSRP